MPDACEHSHKACTDIITRDNPEDKPPVDFEAEREAIQKAEDEYKKKYGLL